VKPLFSLENKTTFRALGETGLGTDKNVGGGKFEINKTDEFLELPDTAQANGQMVLSLYLPKDENELLQLNLSDSKFDITLRGGYMAGSVEDTLRHLRKRSVFMLPQDRFSRHENIFPVKLSICNHAGTIRVCIPSIGAANRLLYPLI
jgi:CRISPR/Cas system CSM-associated protein Csm4 (group 5 of RAMP superfamily)